MASLPHLENYQLLKRLHSGAGAEVFLARARGLEELSRLVAVKRIHPTVAEDEGFRQTFLDEARITVQLSHANIIRVHDVLEADGTYFLVMEYVSGVSVERLLEYARQQGQPMPPDLAAYIVSKVCEGLDYAHRRKDAHSGLEMGIVHRAVSPANILLAYEGEVKLIDFGLAKATHRLAQTRVGALKGKSGYMSPEQVRGIPLDRRSDIFSLGVVLYELLTNQNPFTSGSEFDTLAKAARAEFTPPRELNPYLPAALEAVLLRCLQERPEDRYQTATELHAALSRFLFSSETGFDSQHLVSVLATAFPGGAAADRAAVTAALEAGARAAEPARRAEARPPPGPPRSAPALGATRPRTGQAPAVPPPPPPLEQQSPWEGGELEEEDLTAPALLGFAAPGVEGGPEGEEVDLDSSEDDSTQLVHVPPALLSPPVTDWSAPSSPPATPGAPLPWQDEGPFRLDLPEEPTRIAGEGAAPTWGGRRWLLPRVGLVTLMLALAGAALWFALGQRASPGTVMVRVVPPENALIALGGQVLQEGIPASFPPGSHELVVVSAGYLRHAQQVTVPEGAPPAVFTVTLRPDPAAAPPEPPPPPAPRTFTASISTQPPGARVTVSGKEVGVTPLNLRLDPALRHPYQATLEGYRPVEGELVSASGADVEVGLTLAPLKAAEVAVSRPKDRKPARGVGWLVCRSKPDGADVWINGRPSGRRTPVLPENPIELSVGTYKVVLHMAGMLSDPQAVTIRRNQVTTVSGLEIRNEAEL